ncbi:MAG: lipase family protein [Bacteroidetes bacterium]|nr:MAG: lipase family protein [Bacteroidota bacterium]RLD70862.1 MAG: lipase family protein [Bacteroidota bacterium]
MNKKTEYILIPLFWVVMSHFIYGQSLEPYFDKIEYKELLLISIRTTTLEDYYSKFSKPEKYKMVYQSKTIGLDNHWDLWINKSSTIAVISIRGTTLKPESSLANLYAAMVPAKGKLQLTKTDTFEYELAPNPEAAVHIGWLISMAYLSRDILPKIDSLYSTGVKNILLMGHSQGGAINYLLTAYLYNLQMKGALPKDLRFKTYCSAAPKPGNLYFAYYYEMLTRNGWGYNIVNSVDWVPETPISIQTLNDINHSNPFTNAKSKIKKLKFPKNIVLNRMYNKLDKPTKKAQKSYEKYLGKKTSKFIVKNLKGFIPPNEYFHSNNYARTGATIVLIPNEEYFEKFSIDTDNILTHHNFEAYLYLLEKYD